MTLLLWFRFLLLGVLGMLTLWLVWSTATGRE